VEYYVILLRDRSVRDRSVRDRSVRDISVTVSYTFSYNS